jgi:pimeloyl-ACP methyl ester carboxylesterase/DNA-binding CsgD family transcriptional regulator
MAAVSGSADWKPRELQILRLLAEGLTNAEIGQRLHLAPETVRWYNKRMFERLGVKNRVQAAQRAGALGLLEAAAAPATPPAAVRRPPVRYVANDGVHLAYQIVGDGPVDVLFIHGFVSHVEAAWENEEFARFFQRLGALARVILFDKRGVGLSDRMQGAPTLEQVVADALCVLDAAGSRQAIVMGTSEGGAAAVLLAAMHPERVRGLVLYAAVPVVVQREGAPEWATPPERFERMLDTMRQTWGGPWAVESFAPSRAHDPGFREWWARTLRAASSPASVQAVLTLVAQVDIRALLPGVRTRALVIHKQGDRLVRAEAGRYLAERLGNARFVELPGADHIYFVESDGILAAVGEFLRDDALDQQPPTRLAIVLCALGPRAREPALELMKRSGARYHRAAGAALAAVFDGPSQAVDCARRLRSSASGGGWQVSLHVGECHALTSEPLPRVLAASRAAAEQAAPGQIVVTRMLRDILAGSGLWFAGQTRGGAANTEYSVLQER